jgi:hypothetical protein
MKEMIWINLWLIALYFYQWESDSEFPLKDLTKGLTLIEGGDNENHKIFTGDDYRLEWIYDYDTVVLRFSAEKNTAIPAQDWCKRQRSLFDQMTQDSAIPAVLGSSYVNWGLVDSKNQQYGTHPPTETEFGNLWQKSADDDNIEYVLFTPRNLQERTQKHFLFAPKLGLIKIEGHYHKANTEVKEYNRIRKDFIKDVRKLDDEMVTLLRTLHEPGIQDQKKKLDSVTRDYMIFVEMVASVTKLQYALRTSIENYQERLKILKRNNDHIYDRHIRRFERSLSQITHDLNYYQATISSVRTGLDLLRGANSLATQNSGINIQAAMAVLEIVFVFYYSLGIWHFTVDESTWEHITSFSKLLVGAGLAALFTWGSHSYYVSKKRKICMGCAAGALILVVYAYCVTCDKHILQVLTSFFK